MILETSKSKPKNGFTLVELLLVMGIMSILMAASMALVNSISSNQSMSQVSTILQATLEGARNTAMSHNTYVWVGLLSQKDGDGNPSGLVLAAVESVTGQESDLNTTSNLRPVMKPLHISNVSLASNLTISGMDTTSGDSVDVASSSLSNKGFTVNVNGVQTGFTQIVQFSAQGETLVQSGLCPWVNVGLRPIHGKQTDVAALQISGTTGEIRLFQP